MINIWHLTMLYSISCMVLLGFAQSKGDRSETKHIRTHDVYFGVAIGCRAAILM
ncbi:hypothetical protein BGLA2_940019 [Burkholderia gladioli]|nr:hypothetical protein BGLA2_940019 [Burkholderia gladioli]